MLRSILEQLLSKAWALITALFEYLWVFIELLLHKFASLLPRVGSLGDSNDTEFFDSYGLNFVFAFFRLDVLFKVVSCLMVALALNYCYKLLIKAVRG